MEEALWIDRCAAQLGSRWSTIEPTLATTIATKLSRDGRRFAEITPDLAHFCEVQGIAPSFEVPPENAADSYVWQVEAVQRIEPSALVLTFNHPDATEGQRERALAAAAAVFTAAGCTPAAAAFGSMAREQWDVAGFPEDDAPTEQEQVAAGAWDDASVAAANAAFPDRGDSSIGDWCLELRFRGTTGWPDIGLGT